MNSLQVWSENWCKLHPCLSLACLLLGVLYAGCILCIVLCITFLPDQINDYNTIVSTILIIICTICSLSIGHILDVRERRYNHD
jgi:hypothetical protein